MKLKPWFNIVKTKKGCCKMLKRTLVLMMCAALAISNFAGCNGKNKESGEKISIKIGSWPGDGASQASIDNYEKRLAAMNEAYPDIEIVKDTSSFDVKSFAIKASSGQLPNLYQPYYTEVEKIVNAGYAKDLTSYMEKNGYLQKLNPALAELLTVDDKIWAVPMTCSVQGLSCNKELFKQAGLVDENGIPLFPQNYEELRKSAITIKEKTGKNGMVICSTNGNGGWFFSMLAMDFGVDFIKKKDDKYISNFNTQEMINACQFVYDLKWKDNVLPDNGFVDRVEQRKLFATNQAAMTFDAPPCDPYITKYAMNPDDICFGRVPACDGGRVALVGGTLYMVSPETTDEQLDAIFKWIDISGEGPNLTPEIEKTLEDKYATMDADGLIVTGRNMMDIWVNSDIVDKQKELRAKYNNVNDANFEDYFSFKDVIIRPEVSPCGQQLYTVLDGGIQEILTNKNVDIKQLVKKMNDDFQTNHLDKWED